MATLAPTTVFAGRYKIRTLLGAGGMGAVYRAEHLALRKDVALKVLTARTASHGETRFEREALAIARLDHPSCIRILDYGRTQHSQFIVMELLEGTTLGSEIRQGPLSTARAVRIARAILAALAHAHAHGVLHRDVKPENVMLVGPRVVLIDFGLASVRDERPLTGNGMCLGSPSYIAPERLLGRPYDARADLYAVGVVLYEMLAGRRPFVGPSPEMIMHEALTRPPRPLRALRKDVPRALDVVIRRALAKDPAKRFADAEEMLGALDDVPVLEELHARLVTAERDEAATTLRMVQLDLARPSWWQRVRSWVRYGRWRWRAS